MKMKPSAQRTPKEFAALKKLFGPKALASAGLAPRAAISTRQWAAAKRQRSSRPSRSLATPC